MFKKIDLKFYFNASIKIMLITSLMMIYLLIDVNNKRLTEKDQKINALKTEYAEKLKEIETLNKDIEKHALVLAESIPRTEFKEMIANVYNIDKNLLEAIYMHETAHYTSKLYIEYNNICGNRYENSYEFIKYSNVEQSIIACVSNIKRQYINMGLTSIKQIGDKYAPTNDASDTEGKNNNWVKKVTEYYKKLTEDQ